MPKEPTAGDVMTEGVIAIEKGQSVVEAARKMEDENIRSLVVVDDDEAVGIVVGRDIIYKVVTENQDPHEVTIGDVMTENLVTAAEDDHIEDIARAMIRNDISRVPVLRGENLVGMVTHSNLIRAWPSYVDLLQEETQVFAGDDTELGAADVHQRTYTGVCDECENYSEELVEADGERLCPECRDTGF